MAAFPYLSVFIDRILSLLACSRSARMIVCKRKYDDLGAYGSYPTCTEDHVSESAMAFIPMI